METPRLAVTSVLLRQSPTEVEVLLVRRPKTMRAFGDMWVFPGGQVDGPDASAVALSRIPERQQARSAERFLAGAPDCPDPDVLPLFTAACRELFEEVGVLLAESHAGGAIPAAAFEALMRDRDVFLADAGTFYDTLARYGLDLAVERLLPWSRWITPAGVGRRFDTIFFAAEVPADTQLWPHEGEIAGVRWLPLRALAAEGLRGECTLMAPTLLTLVQLSAALEQSGSLTALFGTALSELITPVRPKMLRIDEQSWIVFPWDADEGETDSHAWRCCGDGAAVPGRIMSPI